MRASENFSWVNKASASKTDFLTARLAGTSFVVFGSAGSWFGNVACAELSFTYQANNKKAKRRNLGVEITSRNTF